MQSVRENPKNYTHLYMQAVENMNLVSRVTAVKTSIGNQIPKSFHAKKVARNKVNKLNYQANMANSTGIEMPRGSKSGVLTKQERLRKTENERENQVLLNKMLSIMNVSIKTNFLKRNCVQRPHPLSTSYTLVQKDTINSNQITPSSRRPGSYMR